MANIDLEIIKWDAQAAGRRAKMVEAQARQQGGKSSVRHQDTNVSVRKSR